MARNAAGRLNPDIRHDAQRGVMQTALMILHQAWPAVVGDPKVSARSSEDDITDILRRRMSDVKRSMKPPPQMRFEREPQSDATDDETELGLIDIMVCYTWNEQTYFVIECKRIWSKDNELALAYVRKGVNRFASGKYSAGHTYGAVVGYVLCGDRQGCIKRIRAVLASEPSTETGFDSGHGWKERRDVVANVVVGSTLHLQRGSSNTIELIHTFVEMA